MKLSYIAVLVFIAFVSPTAVAQSARSKGSFSESPPARIVMSNAAEAPAKSDSEDVIRIPTDLVTIPVRVSGADGKRVPNLRREEFKIFENGVEQEVAYFSSEEQPFTVALLLDMSYSSVFKLEDIQLAARIFVAKLRPHDRVMVIAFDEKPRLLCEATSDRRILRLAIDGARIGSGTALYDSLDLAVRKKLDPISGRRAVVLLSDGVDTTSALASRSSVTDQLTERDILVYSLWYNTFDDVQKSRRKDAQVAYDEDDRPYYVRRPATRGERESDYTVARGFLEKITEQSGGRFFRVTSDTDLNESLANVAEELRRIYSIGYYPAESRRAGSVYAIKVRVYRPNLKVAARRQITGR